MIAIVLIGNFTMSQSSAKRPASSPLSSVFDKKPRLGLTEKEVNSLNSSLAFWIGTNPQYAQLNAEGVSKTVLALTLQQVSFKMQGISRTSTLNKLWLEIEHGLERISLLSREVQLDLASMWVEARDKGEWERFADHRALRPSYHSLRHISKQLRVALLQVETTDQEAGAFMDNQNIISTFVLLCPPATEKSWEYPFQGNAASGLWEHIEAHYNPSDFRVYAHYAAIIQSSGMGKSRTVDELAKDHFVVPLNPRKTTSAGACGLRLGT
jgi:hypothetical protein